MKTYIFNSKSYKRHLAQFCQETDTPEIIVERVNGILKDIREHGDLAVADLTKAIEGVALSPFQFRISKDELMAARKSLNSAHAKAIEASIASVREFHKHGLPSNWKGRNAHGATVGECFYPIDRVGLYIPGGQAPLASTIVMTSTLAKLAEVPSIAAFTPPDKNGEVNPALLATFSLCGVDEVYRLGGAIAVGAMAYGTETIDPVCKIFGPGNAYTNEAKRQVLGTVGIDILAGPSEVMVIADETAKPAYVAADLLAQAEHDSRVKLFLTVPSEVFLKAVEIELEKQRKTCSHQDNINAVLENGYLAVICQDLSEAVVVANYVAPEHLELQVEYELLDGLVRDIRTAGAIFMGHDTPTVLGDFAAGPNHTLPTMRSGRFYSGLQITDFIRRSSLIHYQGQNQLQEAAPIVRTFSELEQLDAHGQSFELRIES